MTQAKRFWLSLLLVFGAMRLADALNAYVGLWLIPARLGQGALGAVLPLMSFGGFLAVPVGVLATVFSRQLCAYAAAGDAVRARGLLRDALGWAAAAFLAAMAVATPCLPWLCGLLRVECSAAGGLAVAYGLVAAFVPLFLAALQALQRFGALASANLLAAPVRLTAMLLLLPGLGLAGYFLGQLASIAATLGVVCWALRGLLRGGGGAGAAAWRADLRPMARYAAKVALAAAVGAVPGLVCAFVIRVRLPEVESGAYYLLTRFSEIATYCGGTVSLVLFPFAVSARARGEESAPLRNGALAATLGGGLALAALFWFLLPWLFPLIPGYAAYVPFARLAAYLTLITACNVAAAAHFSHAQARDDFRYLLYYIPLSLGAAGALWAFGGGSLLRVLHLLLACALAQLACVGAELLFTRKRNLCHDQTRD